MKKAKALIAIGLLAAFSVSCAFAQSGVAVKQSGNVTPNTVPWWVTSGVIGGGVTAADSPISSFGATGPICSNSARQASGAWNSLCFQANTNSNATISLQNYGSASPQNISFVINGASTAPVFPNGIVSGGVNTSYYVATTGNDTNSCLTALLPCLTLQGAWNKAAVANYGIGGITIRIADGTYTDPLFIGGTWVGAGPLAIVGNNTTPSNVVLSVGPHNAISVKNARIQITGIKLISTNTFGELVAGEGGVIGAFDMEFAGTQAAHITSNIGGYILLGSYTISGGGESHWHANSGRIDTLPNTIITITGTPAFSAYFAGAAYYGFINIGAGTTFVGSATGSKFLVHDFASIATNGIGCSNLPGSIPGVFFDTWGLCDGLFSGVNGLAAGAPVTPDAFFTGNSNSVATAALSSPSQFHGVGADNTAAGYACDAFGSFPAGCVDNARFALGTAAAPTVVTGAAYLKVMAGQSLDSTGAYGTNATLDLLTANAQTGTDHGGMITGRIALPGTTSLIEGFRVNNGFMIGTTTPPGNKNLSVAGAIFTAIPVTLTGTSGSVGATDSSTIVNASGGFTLTLPSASANTGRWLNLKSVAAQTISSASSNVVPLAGGAAGTALLASTAGKWATLQSDGTNWIIMASN